MKEPILDEKIEEKKRWNHPKIIVIGCAILFSLVIIYDLIVNNLIDDVAVETTTSPSPPPEPALTPVEQREHDSLMQKGYEALDWLDSLIEVQQDSIDNSK